MVVRLLLCIFTSETLQNDTLLKYVGTGLPSYRDSVNVFLDLFYSIIKVEPRITWQLYKILSKIGDIWVVQDVDWVLFIQWWRGFLVTGLPLQNRLSKCKSERSISLGRQRTDLLIQLEGGDFDSESPNVSFSPPNRPLYHSLWFSLFTGNLSSMLSSVADSTLGTLGSL